MGTVILIGTVAIIVAIVGCFVIWRLDASRAEEVERMSPPPQAPSGAAQAQRPVLAQESAPAPAERRSIES